MKLLSHISIFLIISLTSFNLFSYEVKNGVLYKMTTERRFGEPSSDDYIDSCSSEPILVFRK